MKYIVFPAEKLNEVPESVLEQHHLSPRKSVDGTEVIMKVSNYEKVFTSEAAVLADADSPYPYPTYEGDSLNTLLTSSKWVAPEETANVLEAPVLKTTTSKSTKSKKATVL